MMTPRSLLAGLATTMLLVGTATAQTGESTAKSFLWMQCVEDAVLFSVPPDSLQEVIGEDLRLFLQGGKAQILMAVQDCPSLWFNGEDIGPARQVHQAVRVETAADERPVAGAQHTLPTMAWFAVFTGSDNSRNRQHWEEAGMRVIPVDGLSLDPPAPDRGGEISIDSNRRYSWTGQSAEPFAQLLGVNHDIFVRDERGNLVYHRIQCLANVQAFGSTASLEVTGASDLEGLVKPGEYEASVHTFLPIWCRATLADERLP